MGRERRAEQAVQGGRSQSVAAERSTLAQVGMRFARFRREHRPGTRYPDDLREAALRLLPEVAPEDVYRTCGVSFRQVMAWKAAGHSAPAATGLEAKPTAVRVFSVVDEMQVGCSAGPEPRVRTAERGFELRLGPWVLSVRLTSRPARERGRACCP
jgi:hypothetical protein